MLWQHRWSDIYIDLPSFHIISESTKQSAYFYEHYPYIITPSDLVIKKFAAIFVHALKFTREKWVMTKFNHENLKNQSFFFCSNFSNKCSNGLLKKNQSIICLPFKFFYFNIVNKLNWYNESVSNTECWACCLYSSNS